jgi:glycosyltransferase involved in cell wall biosynthesis
VGRVFANLAQSSGISAEANGLMYKASISEDQVQAVHALHVENADFRDIRTINWFVPDIDMPFFGGLNTAFRLADKFARDHGVANRFVMMAATNEAYVAGALAAAFPGLAGSEIVFYDGSDGEIATLPPADAAVATLWLTAPHVAKAPGTKRKFYLMQDYEPGFYPASTMFAMAEESYRLGLYGICNTVSMHKIYTESYDGEATYFTPAVDQSIYNAVDRRVKADDEPVTIFAYARDHFRNCWELVFAALSEIKKIHGDGVRIVAAGARYLPASADFIDMGLLDYRATGALYRETDIGVTMQISRHPSYLPLELMSSGVAMVAPDSHWFRWLFRGGKNSVLTRRTYDDLVSNIDALVRDKQLRQKISAEGLATIASDHSDWDDALGHIYDYMSNPGSAAMSNSD